MIELTKHETDDQKFRLLTERFVNVLADKYQPSQLFVVATNNWFSHKWVRYAGKVDRVSGVALGCFHGNLGSRIPSTVGGRWSLLV